MSEIICLVQVVSGMPTNTSMFHLVDSFNHFEQQLFGFFNHVLSVVDIVLVCTPPSYRFEHGNFIFGTNMDIFLKYMHIKYKLTVTYIIYMVTILIIYVHMYLFAVQLSKKLDVTE